MQILVALLLLALGFLKKTTTLFSLKSFLHGKWFAIYHFLQHDFYEKNIMNDIVEIYGTNKGAKGLSYPLKQINKVWY